MFGKVIFGLFGWLVFGLPCVAQSLLHAGTTLEVDLGTTVSVPDDLTLSIAPTAVLVNDGRIAFAPLAVLDEPPGWPVRGLGSEDVHPLLNAAALDLEPAGLGFVLTTSIAPGQLDIERGHTAFTDTSGRISTLRWYRTQTSTNTNLDATIRFTYDPTELNGVPEGSQELFVRNGADDRWLPLPCGLNTVLQQVSASALDSVGTYALFDANLPTGILHRNGTSTAWAYPSPASEFVEVVSATAQFNGLTVLDMTGRIVHTYRSIGTVRSYRLDLEGLAPGTYHVVLNDGRSLRFIRS